MSKYGVRELQTWVGWRRKDERLGRASRACVAREFQQRFRFFCCHKCHTKGRNRVKKGGQKQQNEEKNYVFFVGKNVYFEGQNWWIVKECLNVSGKILLFSRLQICLWHLWQQKCKNSCSAHMRARVRVGDYRLFYISWRVDDVCSISVAQLSWFLQQRVRQKTICRFVQSEPSFFKKQPVVLCKVSRRFPKNNPSFCAKCLIVL